MGSQPQVSSYTAAAPRGIFNYAWGVIATFLSALWTMICATGAAIAAMMNKPHAVTLITRAWGRGIVGICGIKVQIEGLENLAGLKSYVLVANHQSFFDIFASAAFLPGEPRFVAKKELLKIPIVGYAMQRGGHIIIDRDAGGQARRSRSSRAASTYASSPRAIATTTTASTNSTTAAHGSRSCRSCRQCRCRSAARAASTRAAQ
jgi:1-acyl-sn-glycerol-3-phosphate acyltransferase